MTNERSAQLEKLTFRVYRISMANYENYHYNKEKLHECGEKNGVFLIHFFKIYSINFIRNSFIYFSPAVRVCDITVPPTADLEYVRNFINETIEVRTIKHLSRLYICNINDTIFCDCYAFSLQIVEAVIKKMKVTNLGQSQIGVFLTVSSDHKANN